MSNRRSDATVITIAYTLLLLVACDGDRDSVQAQAKNQARPDGAGKSTAQSIVDKTKSLPTPSDDSPLSLARAAGIKPYVVDDSLTPHAEGALSGNVLGPEKFPTDTIVRPTVDMNECRTFEEVTIPHRGRGVGQAVVWLVGVTHGPRDTASRRVSLRMERCRFVPRVQRAPMGATVNVGTRNAMLSKLQFTDVGDSSIAARAIISLNDEGQVVPSSDALAKAGLVQVQDAMHPWARAYIAVAPHPFVATTLPDGKFSFEHVPAGTYTLVAWHERLGARSAQVQITSGGLAKLNIEF